MEKVSLYGSATGAVCTAETDWTFTHLCCFHVCFLFIIQLLLLFSLNLKSPPVADLVVLFFKSGAWIYTEVPILCATFMHNSWFSKIHIGVVPRLLLATSKATHRWIYLQLFSLNTLCTWKKLRYKHSQHSVIIIIVSIVGKGCCRLEDNRADFWPNFPLPTIAPGGGGGGLQKY